MLIIFRPDKHSLHNIYREVIDTNFVKQIVSSLPLSITTYFRDDDSWHHDAEEILSRMCTYKGVLYELRYELLCKGWFLVQKMWQPRLGL